MKSNKGFTLIELLIVIAIIGILSAALLPTILNAPARGRDAARIGNMNSIVAGLEAYNSDKGGYPATPASPGCVDAITNFPTYFSGGSVPSDPSGDRTLPTGTDDPEGCLAAGKYYYRYVGTAAAEYILVTAMENANANNSKVTGLDTATTFTVCDTACLNYVVIK